jgi:tripartite-type tricarboxylate transporter receptor subunit TctC
MYFTKLFFTLIILVASVTASAEEYKIIVSFPAGSQADTVARLIQKSIEKNTHDRVVIFNLPGAGQSIGAIKFKTDPSYDVILGSSSQNIFNTVINPNVGYKNDDFDSIIYIGTTPSVWVVRGDSKIQTTGDMLKHMPGMVGGYALSYNTNILAVAQKYNKKIDIVSYKGGNEVIVDIINGSLDLGVVAITPNLIQWVKDGRLRIVGSTYHSDVTVNGIFIPSSSRQMGLPGFNGFVSVDIRPNTPDDRKQKLKKLFWNAINDPDTARDLKNLYILPDASDNKEWIDHFQKNYRIRVDNFYKPPGG